MRFYLLLAVFLAGCRHYHPVLPETEIPTVWKENYPKNDAFLEKNRFWELFNDPLLNDLEEEAIAGSFDLQIATSRIEQARALVKKDHAERLPHVGLNGSLFQDETLLNPRNFGSPTQHLERVKQEQYRIVGDFSYEVDLWGKFRAQEKSAQYRLLGAKWEREFVYQTLVTDVAIHYLMLRSFEEQIAYLEQALGLWNDQVHLFDCRVQAGLESEIDLSKSKFESAVVERQLQQVKQNYTLEENMLAALLGKPASSWKIAPGKLPQNFPNLPDVLPSEVVMRRADIQRALAEVSAGRSDVNVTLRNFFPSFPLTATGGLSTPRISRFFEWQARYWSYAFNVIEPLFDGGRRKADLKHAKARFSEHFAFYQKTVNQAFKDVEDALSSVHYKKLQLDAQNKATVAAAETYSLSEHQFQCGKISYLLVADSKNKSISSEREALFLKGEQLIAWVRLMKALGLQQDR